MSEPEQTEISVVDQYPEWFEQHLLFYLILTPKVFIQYMDKICAEKDTGRFKRQGLGGTQYYSDFSVPAYNQLFDLSRQFYRCAGEENDIVAPASLLKTWARNMETSGDLLPNESITICGVVDQMFALQIGDFLSSYGPLFSPKNISRWLQKTRVKALSARVMSGNMLLDDLQTMIDKERTGIGLGSDVVVHEFGGTVLQEKEDTSNRCIPTPFPDLTRKLGGGWFNGAFILIGGGTDTGKTSLATQIGGHAVSSGYNCLTITTEDSRPKIESRIVSNLADIPYDIIKEGIYLDLLPNQYKDSLHKVVNANRQRLKIIDWSLTQSVDVQQELPGVLTKMENEDNWKPDCIILDWIGGVVGDMTEDRMHIKRLIMQRTADYLSLLAKQLDIPVIATAQLDIKKAYNKASVGMADLSENKTLAVRASVFIGLSGFKATDDENDTTFKKDQLLNIDKVKGAAGGKVLIRRELEKQRFIPR